MKSPLASRWLSFAFGIVIATGLWATGLWLATTGSKPLFPPQQPWRSLAVGKSGDLEIRLEYLPQASLADEQWIRWLFVNTGATPVLLEGMHYRIERQNLDPETLKVEGISSLASGSAELPTITENERRAVPCVQPGLHRIATYCSRYSSTLLGLPPIDGWLVRCTLHVDARLFAGAAITTPSAGLPFEFLWRYPSEAGMVAMNQRLRRLLAEPEKEPSTAHGYILHALLEVDAARQGITFPDMTEALAKREPGPGWQGRRYVAKALHQMGYARQQLVDYFRRRLATRDPHVCEDLEQAPKQFWHDSLLPSLVAIYADDGRRDALRLLDRHYPQWAARADVGERIFAATMAREARWLQPDLQALAQTEPDRSWGSITGAWANAVQALGVSRHQPALPVLAPFLSNKASRFDATPFGAPGDPDAPPLAERICDVALEAMLTIRFGTVMAGYAALDDPAMPAVAEGRWCHRGSHDELRDRVIEKLQAELRQK